MRTYWRLRLLALGVLFVALGLAVLVGLIAEEVDGPGAAAGRVSPLATTAPGWRVMVPYVEGGADAPAIYDCEWQPSTAAWLEDYFGAVSWTAGVTALRCCGEHCAAALVVHVEHEDGRPAAGQIVAFTWPGAPDLLPAEAQGCPDADGEMITRGVWGLTNENGDIGFGMGPGAYYWPVLNQVGPHTAFLPGGGPCVRGLGMLGATDHVHPDVGARVP